MAKGRLTEDEIKWILSVESTEAQQKIHKLTEDNKALTKSNKDRLKEMIALEKQGKKETEAYKNLSKTVADNNNKIKQNNEAIRQLEGRLKISELTMNQLRKRAKELQSQLDNTSKAANPKQYAALEKELTDVRNRMGEVKGSSSKLQEGFKAIKGLLPTIGFAAVGAALFRFGKAATDEFLESEKNAQRLRMAVLNVAGGTLSDLLKLQEQSQDLMGIFDDDDIQITQAALLDFGLTISQTRELLPLLTDAAALSGETLDGMSSAVLKGVDSGVMARSALGRLGLTFTDTGDKTQNYGLIVKGLTRFVGSNTEALEANYGAVEENKNQWGNFKEAVGRNIMGVVTPLIKNFTSVLKQANEAMSTMDNGAAFAEQLDKVIDLEEKIPDLAKRYDELTAKTSLSKDEHEELNDLLRNISTLVPSAVTAWDKYGNAISINTDKLNDYLLAEKARLQFLNREQIEDTEKAIKKYQQIINRQKQRIAYGGTDKVTAAGTTYKADFTEDELKRETQILQEAGEKLKGAQSELSRLQGADIDEMIKRQKAAAKARSEFNAMNKVQLEAWINDEKNAASEYKTVAQQIYNARFAVEQGEKDTSDPNAVALKNLETAHKNQLNQIKLNGQQKQESEASINQAVLEAEIKYYQERIKLATTFAASAKKTAKQAEYKNQVIEDEMAIFEAQKSIDQLKIDEIKKNKTDALALEDQASKAIQASFQDGLKTKSITQEAYDALVQAELVAQAEKKLSIEKTTLEQLTALEVSGGQAKTEAVKQAGQAVSDAEAAVTAARLKQAEGFEKMVSDFKSRFKVNSEKEDLDFQLLSLDAAYKARKEVLEKNNQSTLELDAAYTKVRENLFENHEDRLNRVRAQYGLLTLQQQYDADLELLKKHLEQKNLTQKEYDQSATNLKIKAYKAQYDYMSDIATQAFSALQQAEMDQVDARYDTEIAAAKGNNEKVEQLENEKEKKKLDIQKKYADVNFAIKVSQIIADTAVSIMKAYAELGPIAGTAAAALLGITGAAQVMSASAERNKIKNMTVGAASSGTKTGTLVASGLEGGGSIDVTRAQDGRMYRNAILDPSKRGYIDRPTVLVGENGKEWVASNAAVENPTIAPILNVIDRYQRAGMIRTLDLNRLLQSNRITGLAEGGSVSRQTTTPATPQSSEKLEAVMNRVLALLEILETEGVDAYVLLTDFERKMAKRDKSRKIGTKR